jgi:hypothetical protein
MKIERLGGPVYCRDDTAPLLEFGSQERHLRIEFRLPFAVVVVAYGIAIACQWSTGRLGIHIRCLRWEVDVASKPVSSSHT